MADVTDISIYKEALSQFATGVTIVTCGSEQGPVGITVNSFTSVSLNPPLVFGLQLKTQNVTTILPIQIISRYMS